MDRMTSLLAALTLIGLSSPGCGGRGESSTIFASGGEMSEDESGSSASGEGSDTNSGDGDGDTSSGDGDGDGDGIKFDVRDSEDTGVGETPCGVDILFIVDNSGSMSMHKDAISAAFDGFVDEMIAALEPGTPVHVGVTRATGFYDPGNGSGWGGPACEFSLIDGGWNPPTQANNGVNGQQGRLYEFAGERYHEFEVGQDPSALLTWFQGALSGAIASDDASNTETVVAGAAYPFHPANAEHNAGFLRDKAVLVLFLLSDAPDATPPEVTTDELIALVSDAKAGCGDGCVLPTGVIQGVCYDDPQNTNTRLTEFMNGFEAPPVALDFFNVSDPPASFTGVLGPTLAESIATTCDEIVPIE